MFAVIRVGGTETRSAAVLLISAAEAVLAFQTSVGGVQTKDG